jgi:membrane associated rhomboid family serine protease
MNITPVVKQLLIINIIFFIGSMIVGDSANELLALFFFKNPAFQFWQPITSMFMHGGVMHIAFNMFALYSFGSALEHFWGGRKFLFFYISCGLGSALLHTLVNYIYYTNGVEHLTALGLGDQLNTFLQTGSLSFAGPEPAIDKQIVQHLFGAYNNPALGASGAIYGLLVAFAFMFPNAELAMLFIPILVKAKYFVPGLIAIDVFLGLQGSSLFGGTGTGIAHFAHIGGALVGLIMMWYWKKNQFNRNRWD